MDNEPLPSVPYVRLTIDQLAQLVDRLSVRNRALDDKSRWTWGPQTQVPISNVTATQILVDDYHRRAIIISNPTSIQIFVGSIQGIVANAGISLIQTTGAVLIPFDQFGGAVCRQLWGIGAAPGGVCGVMQAVSPLEIGGN